MGERFSGRAEIGLAVGVGAVVALLVFPLPTWLIDGLLSLQLAAAVVVLLAALAARQPLELSALPTILLLTTLLRLGLNVSTTRLILSQADAGRVVAAFGDVVVAGSYLVGGIVFAVLAIVQYLVIARGAERVAQVAARFALDGLPGRQLAIDADVRAGAVHPEAARVRRARLARESSLFGALDGAMKFVRGDAIASLCIVGVNLVGGLAIGVGQNGMDVAEAARIYTVLTIGDGLVTQIPALLTATAAGLVVTRVASPETPDLGGAIGAQLAGRGGPPAFAAALLAGLALLPGLPAPPLLVVAAASFALALSARRTGRPRTAAPRPDAGPPAVAPLGLVLHPEAARALAPSTPGAVVAAARERLRAEFGLRLPAPSLHTDAADLPPAGYRLEVGEAPVARGVLPPGRVFTSPATLADTPDTLEAPDPATGVPGRWCPSGPGLDAAEYLTRHLAAVWRREGAAALGVQAVADLLAGVEEAHPALVRAVVPRRVDLPRLTRLLQRLVAEDVPVRDLRAVLERLADLDPAVTAEEEQLARLRRGLAPWITARVAPDGRMEALVADPEVEDALRREPGLGPDAADALLDSLAAQAARHPRAALLVAPDVRERARALVHAALPGLPVVTAEELLPGTRTVPVGVVRA